MANAVCRLGDECSGHGNFPPRVNDQGSPDVFVNNKGAHRQGDHWVVHCSGDSCHDSALSAGAPSVFVNNMQLGRVGDPIICGSSVESGSPDVYA